MFVSNDLPFSDCTSTFATSCIQRFAHISTCYNYHYASMNVIMLLHIPSLGLTLVRLALTKCSEVPESYVL